MAWRRPFVLVVEADDTIGGSVRSAELTLPGFVQLFTFPSIPFRLPNSACEQFNPPKRRRTAVSKPSPRELYLLD
jgi:hypothetical protein